MSDDRVPQSLMEAFERNQDGTFRVRHFFGSDGMALLVAMLLPVVVFAVLWLVFWIVELIWGPTGSEALGGGTLS